MGKLGNAAATLALAAATLLTPHPAAAQGPAGSPAEALRRHAEAGRIGDGVKALQAASQAAPASAEARMALGFAQFAVAVERLGQSMHRYGLVAMRAPMIPMLRMPVPVNPRPERLDYAKMRAVYVQLLDDLAIVDRTLAALPAGDTKIVLDLYAVRLDLNGDGKSDEGERLGQILSALGINDRRGMPQIRQGDPAPAPSNDWMVAFDRADAIWLRGYTRLLAAFTEFILAYDWRESFDATAHLFFAGAADPTQSSNMNLPPNPILGAEAPRFADLIAFIHLARWPLVEPARMKSVRAHLKAVVALSRETWREILAETDDDREWLPAPRQRSRAVAALGVNDEQVKGWHVMLDEFDAILDGRRLVPHWRLAQGIDLKRFFEEPRPFDLVLWLTGHAAQPYLRDGETTSQATWNQAQRIFGGQFLTYAIWFN